MAPHSKPTDGTESHHERVRHASSSPHDHHGHDHHGHHHHGHDHHGHDHHGHDSHTHLPAHGHPAAVHGGQPPPSGAHGGHGHAHGLPQDLGSLSWSFAAATILNVLFVAVEATYGVLTDSASLLADAAHNLGDVLGLVFAWAASLMAKRQASKRYTYGLRRTTVLAALVNAVLLLVTIGGVAGEALGKFNEERVLPGGTVLLVALGGVVINGVSAALFSKHAHHDANVRGAFLHLIADALVSLGVVFVGAVLMWQPTWAWLDAAMSLVISAVILVGTWRLLRDALHLSLDGVPPRIDRDAVESYLKQLPGVLNVHDLHIWAISTSESALTTHLVVSEQVPWSLAGRASQELAARFGIDHVTVQLDSPEQAADCPTC